MRSPRRPRRPRRETPLGGLGQRDPRESHSCSSRSTHSWTRTPSPISPSPRRPSWHSWRKRTGRAGRSGPPAYAASPLPPACHGQDGRGLASPWCWWWGCPVVGLWLLLFAFCVVVPAVSSQIKLRFVPCLRGARGSEADSRKCERLSCLFLDLGQNIASKLRGSVAAAHVDARAAGPAVTRRAGVGELVCRKPALARAAAARAHRARGHARARPERAEAPVGGERPRPREQAAAEGRHLCCCYWGCQF